MLAGGRMLLSGKGLTLWRVHAAASTPHSYTARGGGWREAVAGLARAYAAWAEEASLALSMLEGHPCYSYAEHLELVRRLEASAAPDWALPQRPRSSPLDFLRALSLRLSGKMGGDARLLTVLAVDSALSRAPCWAREAWWRLRWSLAPLAIG